MVTSPWSPLLPLAKHAPMVVEVKHPSTHSRTHRLQLDASPISVGKAIHEALHADGTCSSYCDYFDGTQLSVSHEFTLMYGNIAYCGHCGARNTLSPPFRDCKLIITELPPGIVWRRTWSTDDTAWEMMPELAPYSCTILEPVQEPTRPLRVVPCIASSHTYE